MNKPASKEPSMDEILSSIRQIIADEDVPETEGDATATKTAEPEAVEAAADAQMMASELDPMADDFATVEPEEEAPLELSSEQMVEDVEATGEVAEAVEADFAALEVEETSQTDILPEDAPDVALEVVSQLPAELEPVPEMVIADDIAFDDFNEEEPQVEEEPAAMPDPTLSTDIAEKLLEPTTTAAVSHTFSKLGAMTIGGDDLTLDGMLREMLRPMLKEWLDDNLPATVERMVQKEIERISRGG